MAKGGDPRSIDFVAPPPEIVKYVYFQMRDFKYLPIARDPEITNIPWDIDNVHWTWTCLNRIFY